MPAFQHYKTRIVNKTIPSFTKFQVVATVSSDSTDFPQPVVTMRLYALPVGKSVYTPFTLAWRDFGQNIEDFMKGFSKMPVFRYEGGLEGVGDVSFTEIGELSVITDNQETGTVAITPATIRLNLYDTCFYECEGSLMRYPATGLLVEAEGDAKPSTGWKLEFLSDNKVRLTYTFTGIFTPLNWFASTDEVFNVQKINGVYIGENFIDTFGTARISFKEGGPVTFEAIYISGGVGSLKLRGTWKSGVFLSESEERHVSFHRK